MVPRVTGAFHAIIKLANIKITKAMKTRKRKYASAKTPRFGRRRLIALSIVALAGIALALAVLHNNTADKPKNQTAATAASSKGEQPSQSSNATASNSNKAQGSGSSGSATGSGEAPKTPYGSFVSNHNAHLNDSEFSTCLTSAGARCQITFSKDGTSKALDEKTTDGDGAAYWTWKPQDLGLSAGSWQITAMVITSGKTATSTDGRNLVIQP